MKYFCFRFDVDTHKCLRDGVPNLLKIADELNVKFTFFINFGQTLEHSSFVKSKFRKIKRTPSNSLSAFTKLGLKDTLIILLFNPFIGKSSTENLKKIVKSKHELGLHGGKNHEAWLRHANTWSLKKTRAELLWGHDHLKVYIKSIPFFGFASPGFTTSSNINKVLKELGFSYIADTHTDKPFQKLIKKNGLTQIPTNILGEPNGVGYIEYCKALKMTDQQILKHFRSKLNERKKLAVVYDHPYYAGTKELNLVKEMIYIVKSLDYKIITLKELLKNP